MRSVLRKCARDWLFRKGIGGQELPFLRHVAQIVVALPHADPIVQPGTPVVSAGLERAATICCIRAMRRF
jgi:hypothetical protein